MVTVRSPQAAELQSVLAGPDVTVTSTEPGLLEVTGLSAPQIGDAARDRGLAVHELTPRQASLEDAFMQMTHDSVEYHATTPGAAATDTAAHTATASIGSPA